MMYKIVIAVLSSGLLIGLINHFVTFGSIRSQTKTNKRNIIRLHDCKMNKERVEERLTDIAETTEEIKAKLDGLESHQNQNTNDIAMIKGILYEMNGIDSDIEDEVLNEELNEN